MEDEARNRLTITTHNWDRATGKLMSNWMSKSRRRMMRKKRRKRKQTTMMKDLNIFLAGNHLSKSTHFFLEEQNQIKLRALKA